MVKSLNVTPQEIYSRRARRVWKLDALLFLAAAFCIIIIGIFNRNNLLVLVGSVMCGYSIIATLMADRFSRRLSITRSMPDAVFAQEEFDVALRIVNTRWLLPVVSLNLRDSVSEKAAGMHQHLHLLCLPAGETSLLKYTTRLRRRGVFSFSDIVVECDLPFAFFRRANSFPCVSHVTVYPRLGKFADETLEAVSRAAGLLSAATHFRDGEADFCGIHEFREGDNPKHIHWRSTARFQQLMVREYHRYRGRRVILLVDRTITDGDRMTHLLFERGLSMAATFACEFGLKKFQTGLLCGGENSVWLSPAEGQQAVGAVLACLASLKPTLGETLRDLPPAGIYQGGQVVFIVLSMRPEPVVLEQLSGMAFPELYVFNPRSTEFSYQGAEEQAEYYELV